MRIINNTDLIPVGWRFIEPYWTRPGVDWAFVHGVPQNPVERLVRHPNLARYRAGYRAVRTAAQADDALLVSHLPRMAAATNMIRRRVCPHVPQIAFAFNFTELPAGRTLDRFRSTLRGIHEFVVYSEMERRLYPDLFDLPPERFRLLPWAMEPPEVGPDNPVAGMGNYFCAIGGEARDYGLLARAMARLPHDRMVIVARPYSVAGITFPENVTVFTNLPGPQTWALAQGSQGMVIPLVSGDTACGHITIVGAQLLGIPLVVTRSEGVADYVGSDAVAHLVSPGDEADLVAAIPALETEAAKARALTAKAQAEDRNHIRHWVAYFEDLLDRLGPGAGQAAEISSSS